MVMIMVIFDNLPRGSFLKQVRLSEGSEHPERSSLPSERESGVTSGLSERRPNLSCRERVDSNGRNLSASFGKTAFFHQAPALYYFGNTEEGYARLSE